MKQAATLVIASLLITSGLGLSYATSKSDSKSKQSVDIKAPTQATVLYQLMAAEMAIDRDEPDVALANYIAAAKETQDGKIAARATQIALTISSLEAAIEPALIWAKAEPNNLEAQITTAALYIRMDKINDALPFLKRTEKLNQDEAFQYYLILYRQLQNEEDQKRVIQALEMIAKEETLYASSSLALSEIYLYQGNEAKAKEMSQAALNINPHSLVGIQIQGESLLRTQGKDTAKDFIAKKVKEDPKNVLLHQYFTQFLIENSFNTQAKSEIEQIIKLPHLSAEELLQFARLSMQAQWFDLAGKILNRTSKMPEKQDLSHYFLARLAEMQSKPDNAIQWFRQVLTGPFHVLSQVRASVLLSDKKQYDEALTILSQAQPADGPDKKQILLATIEVLNKAQRYNEALALLDENIKILPDDTDLLYSRSLVADHLDKFSVAEKDLKAILVVQPNNIDALNALGFMLANKTKRYVEAEHYLTAALKLAPNNASVLDSLGWLYYKMGKYDESIKTLQKAVEIMPDGEIVAHLGEVLWQTKDFEGAKRVWNKGLEQSPKHETILNAMQRLKVH